jgi:hypothetical protein
MERLTPTLEASVVEAQGRELWKSRGLPPKPDARTDRGGPPIHLSIGSLPAAGAPPFSALQRGVLADVATRAQLLLERTATGPLVFGWRPGDGVPPSFSGQWDAFGLWFGQQAAEPLIRPDLQPTVDGMLGRLAETNVLVAREGPLRWCPRCELPKDPTSILYVDEEGPAYIVRFPLQDVEPRVDALVWTDSAWKLLGATAVLLNPTLPYVVATFTRRGVEERVLTSVSSLDRLKTWLPDSEIQILEQHPGEAWSGTRYQHPLGAEYPPLHSLERPGGQILSSTEVGDSGTGLVALTPAHGAGDARIAGQLEIPGWPVISMNGMLEGQSANKYEGLPVDTAEAFILRDLSDSGLIFAELRVRHGVPRCSECATGLFWHPGRAWMLEPDRIDADTLSLFGRLLPREALPAATEVVPWPASDARPSKDPAAPALLECDRCSRLAPTGTGTRCPCGGTRTEVRRMLLPAFAEAIYRWARLTPLPPDHGVGLFIPEQRRGPVLLTHLVAQFSAAARPADTQLTLVPTGSVDEEVARPETSSSIDAARCALVRMAARARAASPLSAVIAEENRSLRRFWAIARLLSDTIGPEGLGPGDTSIPHIRDSLPEEDRAFVSRFERLRSTALAGLAAGRFPDALGQITGFAERDLRERYLPLVRGRLQEFGLTTGKAAAERVLLFVVSGLAELWAPFAPFTMEAIHRSFRDDARSLFEAPFAPVRQSLIDPASEKLLDLVLPIFLGVERVRRRLGLPAGSRWTQLVLYAPEEAAAAGFQEILPLLSRILPIEKIEIASPAHPWEGRLVHAELNLAEIQRVYGSNAGRIAAVLSPMPGRRVKEGLRNQSLNVVLGGNALQILPSMVELTDSLPPRVLALSFPKGHGFLELPQGVDAAILDRMLGLTPDALRVVAAARRRLKHARADANVTELWAEVPSTIEEELRGHSAEIARSMGISRFEAVAASDQFLPGETTRGRTSGGHRWRIWIPGLPRRASRHKPRSRRRLGPRSRRAVRFEQLETAGTDFLSEEVRSRESTLRATMEQIDSALGVPLVGPAKLGVAWEAGLKDFDAVSHAPYSVLEALPGFGPYVARAIVQKFGGSAPVTIWRWPPPRAELATPPRDPTILPEAASLLVLEPPVPVAAPAPPTPNPIQDLRKVAPAPLVSPPAPEVVRPTPPPAPAQAPVVPSTPLPPWRPPGMNEPRVAAPSAGPETTPVGIALLVQETTDAAWGQFLDAVSSGRRGLCVTREFPDRLRRRIGSRDVTVIWLSNVGRQNSVKPSDLVALQTLFTSALGQGHVSAVLLEGIEYLVTVNTLAPVLKLLRELHVDAQGTGTPVWVPVNPRLLTVPEAEMLTGSFPSKPA